MRQLSRICFAIVCSFATSASAYANDASCMMDYLNREAQVAAAFHDEMGKLISSMNPELEEISILYTQQSKLIKRRRVARVGWLLDVDSKRFKQSDDLYALSWSEKDNQAWIEAKPEYKELNDQSRIASEKLAEHADRAALKQLFKDNIRKSPMLELFEENGEIIKGIREQVKTCF